MLIIQASGYITCQILRVTKLYTEHHIITGPHRHKNIKMVIKLIKSVQMYIYVYVYYTYTAYVGVRLRIYKIASKIFVFSEFVWDQLVLITHSFIMRLLLQWKMFMQLGLIRSQYHLSSNPKLYFWNNRKLKLPYSYEHGVILPLLLSNFKNIFLSEKFYFAKFSHFCWV